MDTGEKATDTIVSEANATAEPGRHISDAAPGVKQTTLDATEADLEARIDEAIRSAFPLLPRDSIRHQTKFSFSFGGKQITIDANNKYSAQARSDVILYFLNKPLAVLELKRPSQGLTDDDSKQGLSYARVINPMPPVVVITNGKDIRFIQTYTGNIWVAKEITEQAVQGLLESAANAANKDLKDAVSTLMATNPDVWVQAIRRTTEENVSELSGGWSDRSLPFVDGFLVTRKVTKEIKGLIRAGDRLVIVEGVPLIGKSNVLRELALSSANDPDFAILFVESEGTCTVLQQIADTLSRHLNWPISKEEARRWLQALSQGIGPRLVIAVDGIGLDLSDSKDEIVDLTSNQFGPRLSIVVELNESCAEAAVLNSTGRQASAIGRRAKRVKVESLDNDEFSSACQELNRHHLAMTHGAVYSSEFRLPWVLRSIGSFYIDTSRSGYTVIPPFLSIGLIQVARSRFDNNTRIAFQKLAGAALADASDSTRPISLILESAGTYVVRQRTLRKHVPENEIRQMTLQGYLKPTLHMSNEPVFYFCLPELVASEVAVVLEREILSRIQQSPNATASWLSKVASDLPFGDIIVAHAIIGAQILNRTLPFDLISHLMKQPPKRERLNVGSRFTTMFPNSNVLDVTVKPDGFSVRHNMGAETHIPLDPEDSPNYTYANIHPWLVLSHIAGFPCEVVNTEEGGKESTYRLDPEILFGVGKCPMILRRPSLGPAVETLPVHDIDGHGSSVCHKAGVVEPITYSIVCFLLLEKRNALGWIQRVVDSDSPSLIARVDIALRVMADFVDDDVAPFASEMYMTKTTPAMVKFVMPH